MAKKVVKGRAVADFLAQNPLNEGEEFELEFPDEYLGAIEIQGWRMHFDGAVNSRGAGIGVILITPDGEMIPMAKKLDFEVTNNQAEYEAFIFGLEALRNVGEKNVIVYGDSMLVIKQASKEWEVKEHRLRLYWDYLATLSLCFGQCNQVADALATLASIWESNV